MSEDLRRGSLPPHVDGETCGQLVMTVKSFKSFTDNNSLFSVHVSWWGENKKTIFVPQDAYLNRENVLKFSKASFVYNISTNLELFMSYLEDCEELIFDVFELRNNSFIGSAALRHLISIVIDNPFETLCVVTDRNGKTIGDLIVSFEYQCLDSESKFGETCQEKPVLKQCVFSDLCANKPFNFHLQKKNEGKSTDNVNVHGNNDVSNLNITVLLEQCQRIRRKCRDLDEPLLESIDHRREDSNSPYERDLIQRLLGAQERDTEANPGLGGARIPLLLEKSNAERNSDLNKCDRRNKLFLEKEKLRDLSGETFYLEECSRKSMYDVKSVHNLQNQEIKRNVALNCGEKFSPREKQDLIQNCKVLRLIVQTLHLNFIGLQKVLLSCQSRASGSKIREERLNYKFPPGVVYFIEYEIPQCITSGQNLRRRPWNSSTTRLCSKRQTDRCVYFHRETVHYLASSKPNFGELVYNSSIIFQVYSRCLNQRLPSLIGVACLPLAEVIDSCALSTVNELSVLALCDVPGQVSLGVLKVKADLSISRKHCFPRPSKTMSFCTDERSSDEELEYVENSLKHPLTDMMNLDKERYKNRVSFGECPRKEKGVSLMKHVKVDKTCDSNNPDHKQRCVNNGCFMKSPRKERSVSRIHSGKNTRGDIRRSAIDIGSPEKGTLLYGLLHISQGRNLKCTSSYLVSHGFWKEDVMTSCVCLSTNSPNFKLHKVMPVLLSLDLLDRCRNNFLIVELWSHSNLIGIAKLPLHQFHIAYRDPAVVEQLILSKYPILGVDGWVNVLDPISQEGVGELHVILALGTESQIQMLEISRCLKEVMQIQPSSLQFAVETDYMVSESAMLVNGQGKLKTSIPINIHEDEKVSQFHVLSDENERYPYLLTNKKSLGPKSQDVPKGNGVPSECVGETDKKHVDNPDHLLSLTLLGGSSNQESHEFCESNVESQKRIEKKPSDSSLITNPSLMNSTSCVDSVVPETSLKASIDLLNFKNSSTLHFNTPADSESDLKNSEEDSLREIMQIISLQEKEIQKDPHPKTVSLQKGFKTFISSCDDYDTLISKESMIVDEMSHNRNCKNRDEPHLEVNVLLSDKSECPSDVSSNASDCFQVDVNLKSKRNCQREKPSQMAMITGNAATQTENSCSENFLLLIDVISAMNLPLLDGTSPPNCYVTIHTADHLVLTTPLVSGSVDPVWNWSREVIIPTELLENNCRRLILRVWNKVNHSEQCSVIKDFVLGFVALDLRVLLYGFPKISGWFNITDFNGCCCGQIQVCLTPVADLGCRNKVSDGHADSANVKNLEQNLASPIFPDGKADFSHSPINRNLKKNSRKESSISYIYPVQDNARDSTSAIEKSGRKSCAYEGFNVLPRMMNATEHTFYGTAVLNSVETELCNTDISGPELSSTLRHKLNELDEIMKKIKDRSEGNTREIKDTHCKCVGNAQDSISKTDKSQFMHCRTKCVNSLPNSMLVANTLIPGEGSDKKVDFPENDPSNRKNLGRERNKLLNSPVHGICSQCTSCHHEPSSVPVSLMKLSDIGESSVEDKCEEKLVHECNTVQGNCSSNLPSYTNDLMLEALNGMDLESVFNPLLFQHILASRQCNNISTLNCNFNNCASIHKRTSSTTEASETSNVLKHSQTSGKKQGSSENCVGENAYVCSSTNTLNLNPQLSLVDSIHKNYENKHDYCHDENSSNSKVPKNNCSSSCSCDSGPYICPRHCETNKNLNRGEKEYFCRKSRVRNCGFVSGTSSVSEEDLDKEKRLQSNSLIKCVGIHSNKDVELSSTPSALHLDRTGTTFQSSQIGLPQCESQTVGSISRSKFHVTENFLGSSSSSILDNDFQENLVNQESEIGESHKTCCKHEV